MWNAIFEFFTSVPLWELSLIFFSKIIEVSIGTMRVILISKGYKKPGSILGFFEVLLWVFVASTVINGMLQAPLKGIIYALGFAIGVYIGSMIENKVAVGKVLIHVIASEEICNKIVKVLRDAGHGVTSLDGHGKDSNRTVLMIFANRKNKDLIFALIEQTDSKALVVANEVAIHQGGFVSPFRRIAK
ncbi:MAG: hypothetical protein CVV58_03015 [Tenericutes bacterium HGW-Tenericutes-3]|nr:MAG: hypothetical protein CVV58_03015 [Tenericutes bacterium HGW-Tenericutes-3]